MRKCKGSGDQHEETWSRFEQSLLALVAEGRSKSAAAWESGRLGPAGEVHRMGAGIDVHECKSVSHAQGWARFERLCTFGNGELIL